MKSAKIIILSLFLIILVGIVGIFFYFSRQFKNIDTDNAINNSEEVVPEKTLSESIGDISICNHDDPELCEFINRGTDIDYYYPGSFTHRYSLTTTDDHTTITIMRIDAEGEARLTESVDKVSTYDAIILSEKYYERDMATPVFNGKWTEGTLSEEDKVYYKNYKTDTIQSATSYANRAEYKKLGTEKCGALDCYVYEFTVADLPGRVDRFFIDTTNYRIRLHTGTLEDGSLIDAEFSYDEVEVEKPSVDL